MHMFLMFSMLLFILFVLFYSGSYFVSLFFLNRDTEKNKSRMFEEEMMKGIYIFYEKLIFNKNVFNLIYHFSHLNNSTFVLHDLVPVLY